MDDIRPDRDKDFSPDNGSAPDGRAVILFDGACNLCNAVVRWAEQRDPKGWFRFVALQSDEAARLLARAGAVPDAAWARTGAPNPSDPASIALVQGRKVHFRSDAVLRIVRRLKFPYPLLTVGLVAPRPLRDAAYDWVARNRYRWFGGDAACPLPTTQAQQARNQKSTIAPPASHAEDPSPEASIRPPETSSQHPGGRLRDQD